MNDTTMNPPPPLYGDLWGAILATSVRLRKPKLASDATHVATVLNVLSRSQVPEASYAAIMLMPWIDTTLACRIGDVWLLETMHTRLVRAPYLRPEQYHATLALASAGGNGHVHVLKWWSEHLALPETCTEEYLVPACASGLLHVLEWWSQSGVEVVVKTGLAMQSACRHGHLDIMAWIMDRSDGNPLIKTDCVGRAILDGRFNVVDWFVQQVMESGLTSFRFAEFMPMGLVLAVVTKNEPMVNLLLPLVHPGFALEPLAFACATGDLAWIQACQGKAIAMKTRGLAPHPASLPLAAAFGHIHVMDWLYEQDVTKNGKISAWQVNTSINKWKDVIPLLADIAPTFEALFKRLGGGTSSMTPFFAACGGGSVSALEWIVSKDQLAQQFNEMSNQKKASGAKLASNGGHVNVLDWLEQRNAIPMSDARLVEQMLGCATENGHLQVLEWIALRTKVRSNPSRNELILAARKGCVDVLDWWQAKGAVHFSSSILTAAAQSGQTAVVKWCIRHASPSAPDFSQEYEESGDFGRIGVLNWLHKCGLAERYGPAVFDTQDLTSLRNKHFPFEILNWYLEKGLDVLPLRSQLDPRSYSFHSNVLFLDLCAKHGLLVGPLDLDYASESGKLAFLKWAVEQQSALEVSYSVKALRRASGYGHVGVLDWWLGSGLQLKYDPDLLERWGISTKIHEWWVNSGLLSSPN